MSRKITDKQRLDWLDARMPSTGSCATRFSDFTVYTGPAALNLDYVKISESTPGERARRGETIRQAIDRAIRSERK